MKLSEAIRLGAMSTPQIFEALLDSSGGTCALGSAYHAAGILHKVIYSISHDPSLACKLTSETFPLLVRHVGCPLCLEIPIDNTISIYSYVKINYSRVNLSSAIVHLNDHHKWTREQIADWVETLEKEIETSQQTQENVEVLVAK